MKTKVGVAIITAGLALYVVMVGRVAVAMFTSGDGVAIAMGVALVILPLIAVWGIGR